MAFNRTVRVEESVPAFKQAGVQGFTGATRQTIQWARTGNITADDLDNVVYVAPIDGVRVLAVNISLENTGTDPTNPLTMAVDVLKNGSYSVLSVQPVLSKAAADKANTVSAGTGITVGVVSATYRDLSAGDRLELDADITRNAGTVTEEMADLLVQVELSIPPMNT